MFKTLDLQYFAEEPDEPTEPTEPDQQDQKDDPKTIPYDRFKQVNDKAKHYESALKELGFEDTETLKSKLAEYKELEEQLAEKNRAEMTEAERLKADLDAKASREAELQSKLEEMQTSMQQEKLNNAFYKEAQKHNITYIDDAMKLADLSEVKVEDGKVIGMEEAISKLATEKPYLVTGAQAPDVGGASNLDDRQHDRSSEQLLKDAADKARKTGRIEDLAAFSKLKRELNAR